MGPTLLIMTPGVDFANVMRAAVRGRQPGLYACLGVMCGFLIHSILAVAGVAMVLLSSQLAFTIVKFAGAAFLYYLGIKALWNVLAAWRAGTSPLAAPAGEQNPHEPRMLRRRQWASFQSGFFGNALNPKAPIIWLSLMPQFIPPGSAAFPHLVLLSTVLIAIGAAWYPLVVLLVNAIRPLLQLRSTLLALESLTGLCLTGLGMRLAFTTTA